MEKKDLIEKAEKFLEKEYGKNKLNGLTKNQLIDKAFAHAWKDATIYARKKKNETQKNIMSKKNDLNKKLLDGLKEGKSFEELFSSYDYDKDNACGFWQKLVNMLFKNLYCFELCDYDVVLNKSIFKSCDCPIDRISAVWIFRKYPDDDQEILRLALSIATSGEIPIKKGNGTTEKVNWNNMDKKQYKKMQEAVKTICKNEKIIPLEFDILYWK